jgi:phytoene/squalene synthetase
VEDEPQTRDHLAEAVMAGLLQDLAALERDLGRLLRRGRVKLPETLSARRVQVQAAHALVATHAGLLAVAQQASVQEALDRLERRLTELEREQ